MSLVPLVSVVMPTYNRANVIGGAIDSILNQTYDNFEFIIVDDGCTDSTYEVLEKYAAKDKRIILLKQNNQGPAAARNAAAYKAKGKYIALMDDDDISLPNRLMKQVTFLEKHPGYDACTSVVQIVNLDGQAINNKVNPLYDIDYFPVDQALFNDDKWYLKGELGPMACLTKQSFINCNGYRIAEHLIIEDLDFTLRFSQRYKTAIIGGEYLYLYTDPDANFGDNRSTKDCINLLKRHIACYISAWFCSRNMPDPVEEDLTLDEIISLITKLPKSDRYLIHKSVRYMVPSIMKTKKISRQKAKELIFTITHLSRYKLFRYPLLSKFLSKLKV